MVVREYRAADDRKRGVAAHKVVRKEVDEVKQARETLRCDRHRAVFVRKRDRVLFVVLIGGILQPPIFAVEGDGDGAQRLSCRVIEVAGKADVAFAQHACGVARLGLQFGERDLLGVLFGLAEVDRDADLTEFAGVFPLDVLVDVRHADVVVRLGQRKKPIGRRLDAFCVFQSVKFVGDGGRKRGEKSEHARFEKNARRVVGDAFVHRILHERVGYLGLKVAEIRSFVRRGGLTEQVEKCVEFEHAVARIEIERFLSIVEKLIDLCSNLLIGEHCCPLVLSIDYIIQQLRARCNRLAANAFDNRLFLKKARQNFSKFENKIIVL